MWAAGDSCALCPLAPEFPTRCTEPEPRFWRQADVEESTECSVLSLIGYENLFTGWQLLEKGLLPCAGGWSEQPAYWIQAFNMIGVLVQKRPAQSTEQ